MYKIAVVGATGNVGREMLKILAEREFPYSEVVPLASDKSKGKMVSFGDDTLEVRSLSEYDFTGTDIALFSAGSSISAEYAPIATKKGCIVIDNSSHFRMDHDVPLIVPEINEHDLIGYYKKYIVANPNCAMIQMAMAIKPLHDQAILKKIVISTYQSVSGAGKKAMDELYQQVQNKLFNNEMNVAVLPRQIAFNVIPQINQFSDDGHTQEELKIVAETQKVLGAKIDISATCVRVPVFVGHSESIYMEFEHPITPAEAKEVLQHISGIVVLDDYQYTTPLECVGNDAVYVSRIRQNAANPRSLLMWVVSDNLRKGAATNAVQIAELLIKDYI